MGGCGLVCSGPGKQRGVLKFSNWPLAPCKGEGSCEDAKWASCEPEPAVSTLLKQIGNIRLAAMDSSDHTADVGRLEVKVDGKWGTVCKNGFDDKDATVACKQLGYLGGGSYEGPAIGSFASPGNINVALKDLKCSGDEDDILGLGTKKCGGVKTNGQNLCPHSSDVKIKCSNSRCEFKEKNDEKWRADPTNHFGCSCSCLHPKIRGGVNCIECVRDCGPGVRDDENCMCDCFTELTGRVGSFCQIPERECSFGAKNIDLKNPGVGSGNGMITGCECRTDYKGRAVSKGDDCEVCVRSCDNGGELDVDTCTCEIPVCFNRHKIGFSYDYETSTDITMESEVEVEGEKTTEKNGVTIHGRVRLTAVAARDDKFYMRMQLFDTSIKEQDAREHGTGIHFGFGAATASIEADRADVDARKQLSPAEMADKDLIDKCAMDHEHNKDNAELDCYDGEIVEIKFASYGKPKGGCLSKSIVNAKCHAKNSKDLVKIACLGKKKCSINAHDTADQMEQNGVETAGQLVRPNDIIALWSTAHKRFARMKLPEVGESKQPYIKIKSNVKCKSS